MTSSHSQSGDAGAMLPAGDDTRCGFVAIIGAPNAGKSTLVNTLVGTKVSIVSHKVQTTRVPVRGIAIVGRSQLIFIDTPGIFAPKRRLDRAMVDAAWRSSGEGDVTAFLIDAQKGIEGDAERILHRLKDVPGKRILIINKIDKVKKEQLLGLTQRLNAEVAFDRTFMIAALTGYGVEDLKTYLAQTVPEGPWHYPEDEISDAPMRVLAAEITRERIYHWLHEELPYSATVETTSWKDLGKKGVRLEQTIFVERESQKKIVIGKSGATIKRLSTEARQELERIVERPVHLFLFVKVADNWGDDPERYREMGLDFPKS